MAEFNLLTPKLVRLSLYGNLIAIRTPFAYKDICKSLSNRIWDPERKVWLAPLGISDEVFSKFPGAEISSELREALATASKLKELSHATSSSLNLQFKDGLQLMPFQKAGVEFLDIAGGRALIADEMGLGKTIETLAYMALHPEFRPVIVVCPASVKINWTREIEIWLAEKSSIVSDEDIDQDAKIYVVNYDILGKHFEFLKALEAQLLVLDESHYIKNYKAQRTRLAMELSRDIPRRILLTGTPVLNRPRELWTQLNILDPQTWGNFFHFAWRYCDAKQTKWGWNFSGASNIPELSERLKLTMIRRSKEQVLQELPEKRRTTIELPIENLAEYKTAEKDVIDYIRAIFGPGAARKANRAEALVRIEFLKQLAARGKLSGVKEWINSFLEGGEKLVVFAHHRDIINALSSTYPKCSVSLIGDHSEEERQIAVDCFQHDPNVKLFLGSLQAGGLGITLTAARTVALVELGWTPAAMLQAEDRVHRIGQKNAVNVYYLLAAKTIEKDIARLLQKKSEVINNLVDGTDASIDILGDLLSDWLLGGGQHA